jgi:hypothetical protein
LTHDSDRLMVYLMIPINIIEVKSQKSPVKLLPLFQ